MLGISWNQLESLGNEPGSSRNTRNPLGISEESVRISAQKNCNKKQKKNKRKKSEKKMLFFLEPDFAAPCASSNNVWGMMGEVVPVVENTFCDAQAHGPRHHEML